MCAHTIAAYINIVRFLDKSSQHWFQKDRRKQTHMINPQSIVAIPAVVMPVSAQIALQAQRF